MNKKVLLIYIFLLLSFVPFTFLFVDVNLSYLKAFYSGIYLRSSFPVTILYTVFFVCLFGFYFFLLRLVRQKKVSVSYVKKLIILSAVILTFSYPAMLSYDIFNYVTTAKVTYFYHENPYLVMPNEFKNEPYNSFTRATNKVALYGLSWIVLSAIPQTIGMNSFLSTLFLFKVLVGVFYLGTSYLIYKMSKSIYAVVFFAFNPLVLLETLVSGHNDVVMIFFALLSFYLLSTRKTGFSILSMIVSILVKFSTLFLLPVWVYTVLVTARKKNINWNTVWLYAGISMFIVFLLSPVREEMYPWYAVWFVPFAALCSKKLIQVFVVVFTFGLMLRYLPFMALGTYQSPTPEIKIAVTVVPLIVVVIIFAILRYKKRTWEF